MKHQSSKEQKNPYLDELLDWYDKTKKEDELAIKRSKEEFVELIKKIDRTQIRNTTNFSEEKKSLWMRIKKTLGIG